MKNNKTKLITYLTICSMLLTGCKMELESILNKDKPTDPRKTTDASLMAVEEPKETQENSINEDITIIPTETEIPPVIKEEIVFATTDVNIRSSNTTESLKIGKLKIYETAYKILSCDNNWDLVRYDEGIGYVCRDYLEYSGEFVESEYTHTEYNDIVLTTTELNFRTSPTTDAEIIQTFNENTELQVVAKVDNDWLLVKNNGTFGYVHSNYTISLLNKANEQYPGLNLTELNTKKVV